MTVKELREALKGQPDDARVLVPAFGRLCCSPMMIEPMRARWSPLFGRWLARTDEKLGHEPGSVQALLLS